MRLWIITALLMASGSHFSVQAQEKPSKAQIAQWIKESERGLALQKQQERLLKVLKGELAPAGFFSKRFLAKTSAEDFQFKLKLLVAEYGEPSSVSLLEEAKQKNALTAVFRARFGWVCAVSDIELRFTDARLVHVSDLRFGPFITSLSIGQCLRSLTKASN